LSFSSPNLSWHPLAGLRGNFEANLAALAARSPRLAAALQAMRPAREYFVAAEANRILLAQRAGDAVTILPNPVPAETARSLAQKIYPAHACTAAVMVAGLDQGWLWHALYEVPCNLPGIPGHRPPLYLLASDLERLWAVLHVQRWAKLLADERCLLFAGADAVAQARQSMLEHIAVPWPKFCLTVEPQLWAPGMNLDALIADASRAATARLDRARSAVALRGGAMASWAGSRPLRVLGITSRYTTFLQHSMRDWLAGFARLGHATRLLIESADHEIFNNVVYAEACAEFRPDLIVVIDHYRREIDGLPDDVPCVMWVQDTLPNIFSEKAGRAQGPLDFCLGFGRHQLTTQFGYPAERFMACTIGSDEQRFSLDPADDALLAQYACDLSYVGHASTPAERIIHDELAKAADARVRRLLENVFERMKAHYAAGGEVICNYWLRGMIDQALADLGLDVPEAQMPALIELFQQRVNNAMYRQQALQWAADLGLDLRLYGRGWEQHPTLSRFARGVADNNTQLKAIYQASRINLQITPFSAVHQRIIDGLFAGGFFLIRGSRGHRVGRLHEQLWAWCRRHGIGSDAELSARLDGTIRPIVERINHLEGFRWGERPGMPLFDVCREHADSDFQFLGDSVWPEYETVAFDDRGTLEARVQRYLDDAPARRRLALSMRSAVVERFTYTSLSRRLLELIGARVALAPEHQPKRSVA
jgi:hypothetical protein